MSTRKFVKMALTAGLLGIVLVSGAWAGQGNRGNPGVVPPGAYYGGMSYAEWSVAWWQWIISIPTAINGVPTDDFPFNENYECASGANDKSDKVWFLVSDVKSTNTQTVHDCTVPVGKALFFPIYNTECSTVEGDPFFLDLTAEHPEDCVAKFFDASFGFRTVRNPSVKIDGKPLRNLEDYRFQSEIFDFVLPPEGDNFLEVPADACDTNPDGCQAIAQGYWILLPPLSKGHHTIEIYGETWTEATQTLRRYINTRYELNIVAGKK